LLVGTLFYARRVIHVRTIESLVGNAKLSYVERLLNRLNLASAFSVSVEGGQRYTNVVDLIGSDSVPIALIPAFVITEQKKVGDNFVFKVAAVKEDVVQTKMRIAHNIGKASFAKLLLADANQPTPPPRASTASYASLFRHYSMSRSFSNTALHLNTKTFKFEPVTVGKSKSVADVVNRTSRGNVLHRALGVGF
jgi:hypothetical protein